MIRSSGPAETAQAPRLRRGRCRSPAWPLSMVGRGGDGGSLQKSAEAGGCIIRAGATAWSQGASGWLGPVGSDRFRDPDLLVWFGLSNSGSFAIGRGWCLKGRAGLGRKAQPPDGVAQGSFFGVQLSQPGVLLPQQLDFFLDQLRSLFAPLCSAPHSQDISLDLLSVAPHSQDFAPELFHSLLVTGIPSPVEHRQKRSPPRQR